MHDGVKDKDLTREQIIARNLKVVDAHFHNETPESVDKAIALYDDEIVWEAPMRGVLLTDPVEIRKSYMGIFRTVKYIKATALRRFATEEYVFDDQIADVEIVGDEMPNLGFPVGSRLNVQKYGVRLLTRASGNGAAPPIWIRYPKVRRSPFTTRPAPSEEFAAGQV